MQSIDESTEMVNRSTQRILSDSKSVDMEMNNLDAATKQISDSVNEMAHGSNHVLDVINNGVTVNKKNDDCLKMLTEGMSKFKL